MPGYFDLAERQHGLVTRDQLRSLRWSESAVDRLLRAGRLAAVHPGVYRIPGAPALLHQRALAAVLWAAPDGVASHATAGRLLRLDGVSRPARVDLLVPHRRRLRSSDVRVHRTVRLSPADVTAIEGIRCTSATRTIVDLAASLGEAELHAAFSSARRAGLTSPARLADRADDLIGRGRPESAAVRRLLEVERGSGRALESRLEVEVERLLRCSSVPDPVRQHPVGRYRLDFAWPEAMVAVEADEFAWHGDRGGWKRDRHRIGEIELLGWRIVFVNWEDVTRRPRETIRRVILALGRAH